MPTGIYNLCVRQDQMDEADIKEIAGLLVDKERAVELAMQARRRQIFFAERAQRLARQVCERRNVFGPRGRISVMIGQTRSQAGNVRQLCRSFYAGMAGKDLFDKR